MAEYIDKSTLLRSFAPIYEHDRYTGLTFEMAKQIIVNHINNFSTIDIVRCKDCKHLNKEEMRCFEVEGLGYRNVTDDDFCSMGEQKDEVEE